MLSVDSIYNDFPGGLGEIGGYPHSLRALYSTFFLLSRCGLLRVLHLWRVPLAASRARKKGIIGTVRSA